MGLFSRLFGWFSKDMAIDLGTANTLIHVRGEGIVVDEPSMVALSGPNGDIVAIGTNAKILYGKTPDSIKVVRPMKDGVIADFDVTQKMIQYFIRQVHKRKSARPRVLVAVPSGITPVEKRAVIEASYEAGVRQINLIEEPMAAAIGAKVDIDNTLGSMVVDIGGGTTEVAIISRSAISYNESIRVAGDEMDEAIVRYLRNRYKMEVGIFEAERIKIAAGSASPLKKRLQVEARGRDIVRGIPKKLTLTDEVLREALNEPIKAIIGAITKAFDNISTEVTMEIMERGIVLAGGGALLRGIGSRLHRETNIHIYRAREPLRAVVRGTGMVMENFQEFKRVCLN
ncbi:MAG: rod shape-determining protein [Nitrospinae bacterium]|nr:rod shape-determining protein [Nitrospinota bacterium]